MKAHINYRLIALLLILGAFGFARSCRSSNHPSSVPVFISLAYIGNTKDGTLTAIDLIKLSPVATVTVGAGPSGIRAHPTRKEIWGLSSAAGYVWVLNVETNQIVARIPVGHRSLRARFFSRWIAGLRRCVRLQYSSRNRLRFTKDYRAYTHRTTTMDARVSPSGKLLLVSNREDSTVSLLDASSLATLGVVTVVSQPEQIEILPDDSKAFITSGDSPQISVVDLKQKVLLTNLALGGTPDDLILKPDGGELYIPSGNTHGLVVVNTSTDEVGDFVLLGLSPTAGTLTTDAQTLYVSDTAAGHVVPVSIGQRRAESPITVGQAPGTLQLSPGGDILLAADAASNDVAVIRTQTSSLVTLIPVGSAPRDIAIKEF